MREHTSFVGPRRPTGDVTPVGRVVFDELLCAIEHISYAVHRAQEDDAVRRNYAPACRAAAEAIIKALYAWEG